MTTEEKKKFENLIQAFALGALDKDDFIEFVHYMESNEDFARQELGEYQNLTALLVSFINPKEPPQQSLERILTRIDELGNSSPSRSPERKTISFTKLTSFVEESEDNKAKDATKNVEELIESPEVDPYNIVRNDQARPSFNRQPGFQRPGLSTQMNARGGEPQERPGNGDRPVVGRDEPGEEPVENGNETESGFFPHLSREQIVPDAPVEPLYSAEQQEPDPPFYDIKIDEPDAEDAPVNPISPRRARRKQLIEKEVGEEFQEEPVEMAEDQIPEPRAQEQGVKSRKSFRGNIIDVSGSVTATAFWGVTATILICFAVVVYFMFSMIQASEEKLDNKIKDLGTAQAKTELLKSTVMMNQNLLLFFSSVKTAGLVNLYGSDDFPETFGKFFYGVKEKKGFLQFSNIMSFNSGKGFQLWIQTGEKYVKAGGLNIPDQNVEFFELNDLPDLAQTGTFKVILTEESVNGSETPSNTVIMSGLLIMKAQAN